MAWEVGVSVINRSIGHDFAYIPADLKKFFKKQKRFLAA
jgi:hypothetical protein